jgi:hypothetical protein
MGSSSDYSTVYLLGGVGNNNTAAVGNYQFNIKQATWTPLALNFSRTGACSAQDTSLSTLWVFGTVEITLFGFLSFQ